MERIEGDTFYLAPDLRGHTTPWFYWYFEVSGAAGKQLTFVLDPEKIGVRGPAVSFDRGVHWQWLGADAVRNGAFRFYFSGTPVRFSVGMPYVLENWERFACRIGDRVVPEQLTVTPAGRPVPLLKMGNPAASWCVALLARHHACEMMGSYLLEGVIEGVLQDTPEGEWLRNHVSFFVVPFMDLDGVERGDQGKNRAPHDPNRDYAGDSIYAEVRAVKEQLPGWQAGRRLIVLDLHNPALAGPYHESIFFLEPEHRGQARELDQFLASLLEVNQGPIPLREPYKLAFGCGFNGIPAASRKTCSTWMSHLPNVIFAASLEIAYANAGGSEVNAETARGFGRDLARALWHRLSQGG